MKYFELGDFFVCVSAPLFCAAGTDVLHGAWWWWWCLVSSHYTRPHITSFFGGVWGVILPATIQCRLPLHLCRGEAPILPPTSPSRSEGFSCGAHARSTAHNCVFFRVFLRIRYANEPLWQLAPTISNLQQYFSRLIAKKKQKKKKQILCV